MKSLLIKSMSFALIAVGLWSCKKDETKAVANISPAGTLSTTATTINLVQSNGTATAVTFSFPAPVVTGTPVPVTTTLQFDLKGNNFAAPKEFTLTTTTYAPKVADLNAMLLSLGAKTGISTQFEARLKSAPAPNAITYSNVLALTATPYLASSWLYAPGAYQDWTPASADSLVSLNSDGVYTGIIAFPAAKLDFKITPAKTWDIAYGDAGNGTISITAGANLTAGTAGLKKVTVDIGKRTWAVEAVKQISIIGSATPKGWDGDTDMKFVNDGKGTWKVTVALVAGDLKFRQDHDWGTNYGGSGGNAALNGDNIKVAEAGNYTISLDIPNLKYTIVKN